VQSSEGSESNSEALIRPSNTVIRLNSEREMVFAKVFNKIRSYWCQVIKE